jgi:hypothetical protein
VTSTATTRRSTWIALRLLLPALVLGCGSVDPPRRRRDAGVAARAATPDAPAPSRAADPPPSAPIPPRPSPQDAAPAQELPPQPEAPSAPARDAAAATIDAPTRTDARPRGDAQAFVFDVRPPRDGLPGVPVCAHWPGTAVADAPLPACPGVGKSTPCQAGLVDGQNCHTYTCPEYCACWFHKGHCSAYEGERRPSGVTIGTQFVFASVGECLAACAAFGGKLQFKGYRADNDAFHCSEAAPDQLCPK